MPIKMEMPGLRELLATLRMVAPEAKREFQRELKGIGQLVQGDTQDAMPKRKGKARRSVKVKVVTRRGFEGLQITEGGTVAPYVPWLDFGGKVGHGRKSSARVTVHGGGRVSVKRIGGQGTGSTTRPYIEDGRYLYRAYFRRYGEMVAATVEAVNKAARSAGLEVSSQ